MTAKTILLFLIAFLVGSDEFLLGPILTPIGNDLRVPPERVTWFIGAYALPLALLAPVLGAVSDRFGRVTVLVPSVALFGLGSIGTALAPDYSFAVLTRVVTGIGAAGMLPVAFASAADGGPERAPAGIAAVQAGLTSGIILAPVYGAAVTAVLGWQAAFGGLGIAAFTTLLTVSVLGRSAREAPQTASAPRGPVLVKGALPAIVAMGFGLGGAIGIYALAGERLRDLGGLGTGAVGLIYAGFGVLTLLGNLLMPRLIGRVADGRQLMFFCLSAGLAAIVALMALPLPVALACLAMAVWALLGGIGAPGLQTYLAGLNPARRGILMALGASAMNLGVAVWSGVAAVLFAQSSQHLALLAVVIIGVALIALGRRGG